LNNELSSGVTERSIVECPISPVCRLNTSIDTVPCRTSFPVLGLRDDTDGQRIELDLALTVSESAGVEKRSRFLDESLDRLRVFVKAKRVLRLPTRLDDRPAGLRRLHTVTFEISGSAGLGGGHCGRDQRKRKRR
jgi:hypothetical protein